MKKYIKQIAILTLFASFASCSEDYSPDMTSTGGNTVLTTTSISRLDKNYDLNINIINKEGVSTSKVEVFYNLGTSSIKLGDKVGDATIKGDGKTATINTSKLRDFEHFGADKDLTTGTFSLVVVSTFSDGSKITNPYTLTVGKGISWTDADGKLSKTSGVLQVKYLDKTEKTNVIRYKVANKSTTTVDKVTMQWKKNKAGVYNTGDDTFPKTKGSIDLGKIDYAAYDLAVGDVLYIKFTVTAGTQTDYIETAITVITQDFDADQKASLTDALTANKLNLAKNMVYADTDTKNGEIVFTAPFGISKEGTTEISFVKVSSASATYYDDANLFSVEVDYMAGTKVTSLTNLAMNDIVIYKITRGTVESYGLIKVGDLTTVNTTNSFNFNYKEGTILR